MTREKIKEVLLAAVVALIVSVLLNEFVLG